MPKKYNQHSQSSLYLKVKIKRYKKGKADLKICNHRNQWLTINKFDTVNQALDAMVITKKYLELIDDIKGKLS